MRKTLLFLLLVVPLSLLAEDFEVNGIYYKVVNTAKHQVEVTYEGQYEEMEPNYFGEVIIPASVEFGGVQYAVVGIGKDCFTDCVKMTSISLPNSLEYLGDYAFDGCSGLSELTLPNSITRIQDSAFAGCSCLKKLDIPGVKFIRYGTFDGCVGLELLIFRNGVKEFDPTAFSSHPNLKNIVFYNTTPPEFYGNHLCISGSVNIHVPVSTANAYKAALNVGNYTIIEDAENFASVESIESSHLSAIPVFFDLNGTRVTSPNKGIYIKIEGSDIKKVVF